MAWNLFGALAPQSMDAEGGDKVKSRKDSGDSGNGSDQESSTPTILEFQLTQSLLDQVRVGKDNKAADSGKQACRDLPTMAFIINNRGICKETVKQWLEDVGENLGDLARAEHAFKKMFESVNGAKVPCPLILEELIRSCNQAGYEFLIYNQIHNIFAQYKLAPTIPKKTMRIRCNSVTSLDIEYSEDMVVKNSDPDQPKQYKSDNKLEFTLKLQDGKIEYENGKVTLTIPEELKKYYANGKHLLDEISKCFANADNRVVEDLTAYFEQGPKSLVADPIDNSLKDEESSFVMASEDLSDLEKLVQNAVEDKDVSALRSYVNSLESSVKSAQHEENLPIVKRIHEIVDKFAKEHDKAWSTYVDGSAYAFLQKTMGYISHADYKIVQGLTDKLNNLRKLLEDRKDITTSPVEEQLTFPVATNSVEPEGDSGKQAGGNVLETKKENDIINSIEVLTQESVRNNFIRNCKEGVMGGNKKSGFNSKYSRTKQSTSGKGAPIEDKKRTKKSEIHNKQLLVEPNADVSNKQPIDQEVHKFVDGVVKTSNKTPVGQPEDSSSGTGAGNDNGTNTCVDPKVTIPKILDFEPPVENKQVAHGREDSGCSSGSSTPGTSEEVSILNDTHRPKARDAKQIIDIDKHNEKGLTPLHIAALKGDVHEGDRLIKLGANIEITSETGDGNTALHLAAQKGHKDFVELLLKRGANVNALSSTESGATPLHEAAYEGHIDIVKLLIARKATIDARDRHNGTPLKYASAQGHSEVVRYLLQKKANPYLQNDDGETALHNAAEHGHPGVASILISKAKDKKEYVNTQGVIGTALHVIAYNREINEGHKKVIKLLLDNGTCPYLKNNPKDRFSKKEDSLTMARRRGNTEFIEFMTSLDYSIPPQVTPTEVPAQISGDNIPDNGEPDKNSQRTQNSKWPIVFLSAGIGTETLALSMYFVLDASLLATGIVAAIGACFLVAAVTTAIVYYYESKSSVKSDNVTHVAANGPPVNSPAAS